MAGIFNKKTGRYIILQITINNILYEESVNYLESYSTSYGKFLTCIGFNIKDYDFLYKYNTMFIYTDIFNDIVLIFSSKNFHTCNFYNKNSF